MSVHLALVASAAMTAPSSLQTGVPVSTVSIAGRARRALALYRAATPLSPSVVLRYTESGEPVIVTAAVPLARTELQVPATHVPARVARLAGGGGAVGAPRRWPRAR